MVILIRLSWRWNPQAEAVVRARGAQRAGTTLSSVWDTTPDSVEVSKVDLELVTETEPSILP